MSQRLIVRVTDLFGADSIAANSGAASSGTDGDRIALHDAVEVAVRRNLQPSMSSHVVSTGAGILVTIETTRRGHIFSRRGRVIVDLDAVLTAVHNELETAVAAPKAVDRGPSG